MRAAEGVGDGAVVVTGPSREDADAIRQLLGERGVGFCAALARCSFPQLALLGHAPSFNTCLKPASSVPEGRRGKVSHRAAIAPHVGMYINLLGAMGGLGYGESQPLMPTIVDDLTALIWESWKQMVRQVLKAKKISMSAVARQVKRTPAALSAFLMSAEKRRDRGRAPIYNSNLGILV